MPSFTMNDTELEQARLDTERETQAEVVRDAIELYKYLLNEVKQDEKIFIGKSRNNIKDELNMTTLEVARERARKSRLKIVP